MTTMNLKIKCLDKSMEDSYKNHSQFHPGDSGLDIFFPEDCTIPARKTVLVPLGIAAEACIDGRAISYWIAPRSSICKTPLIMANSIGLVDREYRGEFKIPLHNTSNEDYSINKGERLCQIINPLMGEIKFEVVDQLSCTSRGAGGFGSTGK